MLELPQDVRLGKLVVRLDCAAKVKEDGRRKTVRLNELRAGSQVEVSNLRDPQHYQYIVGKKL